MIRTKIGQSSFCSRQEDVVSGFLMDTPVLVILILLTPVANSLVDQQSNTSATSGSCEHLLSAFISPQQDTQFLTELYSVGGHGLVNITNNTNPLSVVYWNNRHRGDARLVLDTREISRYTEGLDPRKRRTDLVTIRSSTQRQGGVRYLAAEGMANVSARLTLQNSLGPKAFWKWEKQPEENYMTLHNNVTMDSVTQSMYLGVHRNGVVFLRAGKPPPDDFRFLFRPCFAQFIRLAGSNGTVVYSTCWWTGLQTAGEIVERIVSQCKNRSM